MDAQRFDSGVEGTLKANTFGRTGYTFKNWNTNAAGTGTTYANQGKITITQDTTLYAQWTPIVYTIAFNGNGATSGSMRDMTIAYDQSANLTDNGFTKTGYSFVNWNTRSDGTGTTYVNQQLVKNELTESKTLTLYAQWKAETSDNVHVTFNTIVPATAGKVTATATYSNVTTELKANGSDVRKGSKVVFTVETFPGYKLTSFSVPGSQVTASGNTYTITSIQNDATATATFEAVPHLVKTVSSDSTKGIVKVDANSATIGTPINVSIEIYDENYTVSSLTYSYNNGTETITRDISPVFMGFLMPAYETTVTATFAEKPLKYALTSSTEGSGTLKVLVDGNEASEAAAGSKITLVETPRTGNSFSHYEFSVPTTELAGVTESNGTMEFYMPPHALNVKAVFVEDTQTTHKVFFNAWGAGSLTANVAYNGSFDSDITPGASVGQGAKVTFTVSPSEGWSLYSFRVNGKEIELSGTTYTIDALENTVFVEAVFARDVNRIYSGTTGQGNGTLYLTTTVAKKGDIVTVIPVADEGSHLWNLYYSNYDDPKSEAVYIIDSLTDKKAYQFVMPGYPVQISAAFEKDTTTPYKMTWYQPDIANGTIKVVIKP